MRTQVGIVGGGPAGLLLARKLSLAGIETVVLERHTREYVESRIRAGVLEWGTVEQLRDAGVGARMDSVGLVHGGCQLASGNRSVRVDFEGLTGRSVMVYGQTEITRDLYEALEAAGTRVVHEAQAVSIQDALTDSPRIEYMLGGSSRTVECEFIAGCDGFHGISRKAIPDAARSEFSRAYPFGWLGLLSESRPVSEELIYSRSSRGFALASMRNPRLSRYYIQVPADERLEDWPDEAFWEELRRRLPEDAADALETGPALEKSIAPLRSFVSEPMSHGRLHLCGDASHIVPPTGAKGLNLAASDVHYLCEALVRYFASGNESGLKDYSRKALSRVWKAMRFSWWMTSLMHAFPERSAFDQRIQEAEYEYVHGSEHGRRALAENYTGPPY